MSDFLAKRKAMFRPNEMNIWNVDNTSDADKPISVPVQAALDAKLNEYNPSARGALALQGETSGGGKITVTATDANCASLVLQEEDGVYPNAHLTLSSACAAGTAGANIIRWNGEFLLFNDQLGKRVASSHNDSVNPTWNWETTVNQINANPLSRLMDIAGGSPAALRLNNNITSFRVANETVNTTLTFDNLTEGMTFYVLARTPGVTGTNTIELSTSGLAGLAINAPGVVAGTSYTIPAGSSARVFVAEADSGGFNFYMYVVLMP